MPFEGLETPVGVEQDQVVLDTPGGDQRADRPADRDAHFAKPAGVVRGLKRDVPATELHHGKAKHGRPGSPVFRVTHETAQDLREDEIAGEHNLLSENLPQPCAGWCRHTAEKVDPYT